MYEYRENPLSKAELLVFTKVLKTLRRKGRGIRDSVLVRALETHKTVHRKYLQHSTDFISTTPQERWSIFIGNSGVCETPGCNNYTNWRRQGYNRFCSKQCAGPNTVEGRKATCRATYGVDHISQVPTIQKKMSKALRAAHAAKGNTAPRKGKFSYVAPKIRPNTGTEFYVYVLLDPRKPGNFQYGKWKFEFEPFYVGKGKGNRALSHARNFDIVGHPNPHKNNKIRSMVKEGFEPTAVIKRRDLDEATALLLEARLIHAIGCGKLGPLVNSANVVGGISGYKHTRKTLRGLSDASKQVWAVHTEEERADRCLAISRAKGSMSADEYRKELKARFKTISVSVPETTKFRMTHKVPHTCQCGHTWSATPQYVLANNGCAKCLRTGEAVEQRNAKSVAAKAKRTLPRYLQHLKDTYGGTIKASVQPTTFTMSSDVVHTCNLGHTWIIRPRLFMRYQNGCPYCMTHTRRTAKSILLNIGHI